jgi:hypothetical protein|tara:strand:+ start:412 stop:606 length:195 start_codon:yes stop_codon:yes gene_type:complete
VRTIASFRAEIISFSGVTNTVESTVGSNRGIRKMRKIKKNKFTTKYKKNNYKKYTNQTIKISKY